ncbi:low-affinity Fe(2+) transport protein [Orbilia ellipsospora]
MRQLINAYEENQKAAAQMRSRLSSHKRMFEKLKSRFEGGVLAQAAERLNSKAPPTQGLSDSLAPLNLFGRIILFSSRILGHIVSICVYWTGIFLWIGFGHYCGWTNEWQLYINSATSAMMVFVFSFIACLHECYSDYIGTYMDAIYRLDASLELELRSLTDDNLDHPLIVIPAPKKNWLQVWIFYYADVIGTLLGIVILVTVIIVWVAVGPVLHFSNIWWLLIGTYAGLVGLFDSFVLRNIQEQVKGEADAQVEIIDADDAALFEIIGIPMPDKETVNSSSLSYKVSSVVGRASAHLMVVVIGFLITIGCVVGSSVMKWSETGQLISNVPPSIIETFFMLILITGQIYDDAATRTNFKNIYNRRQKLLSFMKEVKDGEKSSPISGTVPEKCLETSGP